MTANELDLDALAIHLHSEVAWTTGEPCTCRACENGRALIAELRQARAERDTANDQWGNGECCCDCPHHGFTEQDLNGVRPEDMTWEDTFALLMARAERAEAERDAMHHNDCEAFTRLEAELADLREGRVAGHGHDSALCMSWRDRAGRAEAAIARVRAIAASYAYLLDGTDWLEPGAVRIVLLAALDGPE